MLPALLTFDSWLFRWLNELPHPEGLNTLMDAASTAGTGAAVWIFLAGVLAFKGDPGAAFRVVLAVLLTASVTSGILKPWVGRDRPTVALEGAVLYTATLPASDSFPSGHAAGAAAGAYATTRRWPVRWPWLLATTITLSRVYLGVHYPLDLLAGVVVGLACAAVVTWGTEGTSEPWTSGP